MLRPGERRPSNERSQKQSRAVSAAPRACSHLRAAWVAQPLRARRGLPRLFARASLVLPGAHELSTPAFPHYLPTSQTFCDACAPVRSCSSARSCEQCQSICVCSVCVRCYTHGSARDPPQQDGLDVSIPLGLDEGSGVAATCDECEEEHSGLLCCRECGICLCAQCANFHRRSRRSRHHHLREAGSNAQVQAEPRTAQVTTSMPAREDTTSVHHALRGAAQEQPQGDMSPQLSPISNAASPACSSPGSDTSL